MTEQKTIKVPAVIWVLGDREQFTQSGITRMKRPLYYRPVGAVHPIRVADIDPDYAEVLMRDLLKVTR